MAYLLKQDYTAVKNRPAVIYYNDDLVKTIVSYQKVLNMTENISAFIAKNLCQSGTCVGLKMTHNIFIPSIILSLQQLQCAFIFLDPHNTGLEELKLTWILSLSDKLHPDFEVRDNLVLEQRSLYVLQKKDSSAMADSYLDCFCVVCTSGTTGQSKFVKVTNRCIGDNIESLSTTFGITEDDVIYFGTPLTFDPSLVELLLGLANRACLLMVSPKHQINPSNLYKCLFQMEDAVVVTVLQVVPSLFFRWRDSQIGNILLNSSLRVLAFGGEPFPECICKFDKSQSLRVFNLYGITEVSCWATAYEKSEWIESGTPIGAELGETVIEVRDSTGGKVTDGEGEIYIGLGATTNSDNDLGSATRVCLIDDEKSPKLPIFRPTGDLAVINDKGVFYKGRKNDTFKRLGYKLTLSKIEALISTETGLPNCCVWFRDQSKLLCYIKIENCESACPLKDKILDKVRVKLLHCLPKECYPDFIELVTDFPLTCHGKVDRRKLENMYVQRKNAISLSPSSLFKSLIKKYLGLDDNEWENKERCTFMEAGGNSVLTIQLLSEFSDELNTTFPNDLVELLFTTDLKTCYRHLETFRLPKQPDVNLNPVQIKKRKTGSARIEILWKYNMDACVDCTPLVFTTGDETFVAAGSFSHIFAVINANSGEPIAKFTLPDTIESTACLSPCAQFLYVPCFDGKLYCLEFLKNAVKWVYVTDDRIKCAPRICRKSTGLVFGSYDKHVHCIDIFGGNLIWRALVSDSVISTPLCDNARGRIYLATIRGKCLCLSEQEGAIVWTFQCNTPIFGSPCFSNKAGNIIWPDVQGTLHCFSLAGENIWNFNTQTHIYSSLVCYEQFVIFGGHDSNLYVVKVGDNGPRLSSVISTESAISSTPCVWECNNKTVVVVACNSGAIYLIDFISGQVLGDCKLPGEIFSSPVIDNGKLFIGCRDNNLYCANIF